MYKIAICEDEQALRDESCSLAKKVLDELGLEHEITPFEDAAGLLRAVEENTEAFDLLLLDIMMDDGEPSGMELAQHLRRRDVRTSIVFVTGSESYLKDGYGVQPLQYILKPLRYEALLEVIQLDIRLNHSPQTLTLNNGRRSLVVNVRDICYIESMGHLLRIFTATECCEFPNSLASIQFMLPTDRFCRCHRSFLVNLSWVRQITRTTVQLLSGASVPIGRKYYPALQSAFVRYMNS